MLPEPPLSVQESKAFHSDSNGKDDQQQRGTGKGTRLCLHRSASMAAERFLPIVHEAVVPKNHVLRLYRHVIWVWTGTKNFQLRKGTAMPWVAHHVRTTIAPVSAHVLHQALQRTVSW